MVALDRSTVFVSATEPGAGADPTLLATRAVLDGDEYVINGHKWFSSNASLADFLIVMCVTDPDVSAYQGSSMIIVPVDTPGVNILRDIPVMDHPTVGGQLDGGHAEILYTDVRVPKENLLGAEGSGFVSLMQNLPQERVSIGCIAVAAIEHVLDLCLAYAKEREAFGRPIGTFQHNRFVLAEMATEAHIARVFINDCVLRLNAGEVDTALASMAKWWTTELQKRVVDAGVQLHGGYGYMNEYPISKAYTDSRIQTIYGGTTEIQKEIIGRMLGL